MNKTAKVILALVCLLSLAVGAVFATLAYFTDSDAAVNTMTVGEVYIDLDETDVDGDSGRDKANEYKLIPGHTYVKDPMITVQGGSSDAYVRMIVTVKNYSNLTAAIPNEGETAEYYNEGIFLLEKLCGGWNNEVWEFVKFDSATGSYEFRYVGVVAKSDADTELAPLFTTISVPGVVDNTGIAALSKVEIVVAAHAIQAAGFADADAAWEAFGVQNPGV